jgi:hypothetical protein
MVSNFANNGRTGLDANSVLTSIGNFDPKAPCDDVTHISVFGITSNSNGSSSFLTTVHRIDLTE